MQIQKNTKVSIYSFIWKNGDWMQIKSIFWCREKLDKNLKWKLDLHPALCQWLERVRMKGATFRGSFIDETFPVKPCCLLQAHQAVSPSNYHLLSQIKHFRFCSSALEGKLIWTVENVPNCYKACTQKPRIIAAILLISSFSSQFSFCKISFLS